MERTGEHLCKNPFSFHDADRAGKIRNQHLTPTVQFPKQNLIMQQAQSTPSCLWPPRFPIKIHFSLFPTARLQISSGPGGHISPGATLQGGCITALTTTSSSSCPLPHSLDEQVPGSRLVAQCSPDEWRSSQAQQNRVTSQCFKWHLAPSLVRGDGRCLQWWHQKTFSHRNFFRKGF